jgi:phosphatidylserine/phosphatidylglycerophosphate/cardiolipin synthase-like enzyme
MKPQDAMEYQWLETGGEMLSSMLTAIAEARQIHPTGDVYRPRRRDGRAISRSAHSSQQARFARAVLVDAVGSMVLPESFWGPLRASGGEFSWFNPLSLSGWSIRDHRKLLGL